MDELELIELFDLKLYFFKKLLESFDYNQQEYLQNLKEIEEIINANEAQDFFETYLIIKKLTGEL